MRKRVYPSAEKDLSSQGLRMHQWPCFVMPPNCLVVNMIWFSWFSYTDKLYIKMMGYSWEIDWNFYHHHGCTCISGWFCPSWHLSEIGPTAKNDIAAIPLPKEKSHSKRLLAKIYYSPQSKVSISLRLVQKACRNWAIAPGVTPCGPKYAQES